MPESVDQAIELKLAVTDEIFQDFEDISGYIDSLGLSEFSLRLTSQANVDPDDIADEMRFTIEDEDIEAGMIIMKIRKRSVEAIKRVLRENYAVQNIVTQEAGYPF